MPRHLQQVQGLPALAWARGDMGRRGNALTVSAHSQQEGEKASTPCVGTPEILLKPHKQVLGAECTLGPLEQVACHGEALVLVFFRGDPTF